METALKQAIEAYAELTGRTVGEVAKACQSEGVIRESVMFLLFSQAEA